MSYIFAIRKTVVPAQAGTYAEQALPSSTLSMDSRLRGNDGLEVSGLEAD
jgi:hypothetical protein